MNDSVGFFSGGVPSAKFPAFGSTVTGIISEDPQESQQTDMDGKLKTWNDSGEPMLQLVVTLATDERDPEIDEDDGQRRVYVKGQMRSAFQAALKASKSKGLNIGDKLSVTYTHDGEKSNPKLSAPKQYVVVHTPGHQTDGGATFLGTSGNGTASATAAAAQPASVPVPENLPPGMTAEIWQTLTPDAQAALRSLASK